jgi:hypothetical protein
VSIRVPSENNSRWWVEVSQDKTRLVCPDHANAWLERRGNAITISRITFNAANEAEWQEWLASRPITPGSPPRRGLLSRLRRSDR